MDFRDILHKFSENNEKKVVNESVETKTENTKSLKQIFEALSSQTPIPVVGKQGDKASTQAGFIHIDDNSPAGKAMSQALSNLAKDKKAQIVVPTTPQANITQKPAAGVATQSNVQSNVQEDSKEEKNSPKVLRRMYRDNENANAHTENALLLATHFGTDDEVKDARLALRHRDKHGGYSSSDKEAKKHLKVVNNLHKKYSHHIKEGAEDNPESAMLEAGKKNNIWVYNKLKDKYYGPFDSKSIALELHPKAPGIEYKELPNTVRNPRSVQSSTLRDKNAGKVGAAGEFGKALEEESMDEALDLKTLRALAGKSVPKSSAIDPVNRKPDLKNEPIANPETPASTKDGKLDLNALRDMVKDKNVEESGLQAYLGKKKYGEEGMKALQKAGREGASKEKMAKIRAKHDKLDEVQVDEKAKNPYAIGMAQAMKSTGDKPPLKKSTIVKAHDIAKSIKKKEKTDEAERPSDQADFGAGLGAGRSSKVLENKQVNEAMNTLEAAYHEGKSHGLSKHSYACRYDEGSEEHRRYHEGFKEGIDECYGLQPNRGLVVGETGMPAATVPGMAQQAMPAMEADMEEGNAFTAKLASTPKGGSFSLGGKTYKDTSSIEEADMFAFESLDKQLNDLLNESTEEVVTEGMSVSVTQGMQGMDDTVNVSATDKDADALLNFVKTVALADGDAGQVAAVAAPAVSDYGAPKFAGHDDMAALIQKVSGGEDFAPEEKHGEPCSECGMAEGKCGCGEGKEMVDEVESEDQMEFEVSEGDGEGNIEADAQGAEIDAALAVGSENEKAVNEGGDGAEAGANDAAASVDATDSEEEEQEALSEWANEAGKKGTDAAFERDIEFMTKVISGGLNKPKSTGQTTIPVIAGQEARMGDEDVTAWKKLAGLLK